MAGSMDWLDTLASGAVDIAGRAVDAAGTVAVTRATQGAREPDQTPPQPTSALQVAPARVPMEWIAIGGVALAVLVIALKG